MKTEKTAAKPAKKPCEAETEFCSNEMVLTYGVNGSEKKGETFRICGACMVILKRQGSKFKQVVVS